MQQEVPQAKQEGRKWSQFDHKKKEKKAKIYQKNKNCTNKLKKVKMKRRCKGEEVNMEQKNSKK